MDVIFRKSDGTAERPDDCIPCRTAFEYEGEAWRALALYPCRSGIVLDLCREIPRAEAERFLAGWGEWIGRERELPELRRLEYDTADPFRQDVHIELLLDGLLAPSVRRDVFWHIPAAVFPLPPDAGAADTAEAYGLARDICWGLFRLQKTWPDEERREIKKPALGLRRRHRTVLCGERFSCRPGDAPMDVPFRHPVTGEVHTLHIYSCSEEPMARPISRTDHEDGAGLAGALRQIPEPDEREDIVFPGATLRMVCGVEPPVPERERLLVRNTALGGLGGYTVRMGGEPAMTTVFGNPAQPCENVRTDEWFLIITLPSGKRRLAALEI